MHARVVEAARWLRAGGGGKTNLLLEDILGVLVQVAAFLADVLLELGDAGLLSGEVLVVVGLLLDEALDGRGGDGEGRWGSHGGFGGFGGYGVVWCGVVCRARGCNYSVTVGVLGSVLQSS